MGLVNGSMGSVVAICYENDGGLPHLPLAVLINLTRAPLYLMVLFLSPSFVQPSQQLEPHAHVCKSL